MTSNSRQTRTGNAEAAVSDKADAKRTKTPLERWLEPSLPAPTPSFMEYPHLEIVRHGVLENMAPLGTMPSAKLRKMAKLDAAPRRIKLISKGRATVSAATTSVEATPEPETRVKSESAIAEDAEWNPLPSTPVRQTDVQRHGGDESVARQSVPASAYSTPGPHARLDREMRKMERVLESACDQARQTGHVHTFYAMRALYEEQKEDPRIRKLFELIATSDASEKEREEFLTLITRKKKEGRTTGESDKYLESHDKLLTPRAINFSAVEFSSPAKSPSKKAGLDATSGPRSASPNKDADGHVNKKQKVDNCDSQPENVSDMNGNGIANGAASAGRTRSNSVLSSDSDLSSVDEELVGAFSLSPNQKQAVTSTLSGSNPPSTRNTQANAAQSEPITQTSTQKSPAPRLHAFSTASINSAAAALLSPLHPTDNLGGAANNMPARAADLQDSSASDAYNLGTTRQLSQPPIKKQKKGAANGIAQEEDEGDRALRLRKRAARERTDSAEVHESYDRHYAHHPIKEERQAAAPTPKPQAARSGQVLRFRGFQKVNDDSERLSSPTLPVFQPDAALGVPNSSAGSRAGTPGAATRATRKPKGGLRMKTSPMKKKTGPSAGLPRASGERNSPIANGGNQDDNDDYCSSCGGNGDLVCCDGCTRSFHFRCVDPPLTESSLPDTWFCNVCNSARNPVPITDYSLFGPLLSQLHRKNPSAFHLPKDIREYFEDVRTGAEGEYEDVPNPATAGNKGKKNAGGYDDAPDFFKQKDSKGNYILCHVCGGGASAPAAAIISCTFCGLHFHLDCLDPPLANPPPLARAWRCPCHVDDLLAKVPVMLGPAHRFRKIKGSSVIKPCLGRGFRNIGHIEVDLVSEEEEGFDESVQYGRIYKLPEEGIKLDFMSRIRSQALGLGGSGKPSGYPLSLTTTTTTAIPTPPPDSSQLSRSAGARSAPSSTLTTPVIRPVITPSLRRSLAEQQAALNLAQFAAQTTDVADGGGSGSGGGGDGDVGGPNGLGGVQELINALVAEAPDGAIEMLAAGDATRLAAKRLGPKERESLRAMKALIERALASSEGGLDGGQSTAENEKRPVENEHDENGGSEEPPAKKRKLACDVADGDVAGGDGVAIEGEGDGRVEKTL